MVQIWGVSCVPVVTFNRPYAGEVYDAIFMIDALIWAALLPN